MNSYSSFIQNMDNVEIEMQNGPFMVVRHYKDMSIHPDKAIQEYFMSQMNCHKRQLFCDINNGQDIVLQKGAMQFILGDVECTTGIKSAGDLVKKAMRSAVAKDSAVKPVYSGNGLVVTEPTYKFLIAVNPTDYGKGFMCDDNMFVACTANIQQGVTGRKNLSSAVAGGEGMFNATFYGNGTVILQSKYPIQEMYCFDLDNDQLKIDGPMAVCWSTSLDFTVERSSKTLIGSAVNGEGLVNVFRGTGRVLMAPV